MPSFAGATFEERGDEGTFFPAIGRSEEHAVLHIPGSNTNIIQTFGRGVETFALRIRCTKSELDALISKVGSSGSLSYSYGTATAFLASVGDAREVLAGGKYFATLNLII